MEDAQKILTLDRGVPFVDAVFRVMAGEATETEAALILRSAELMHEVCFVTVPRAVRARPLPDRLYVTAEGRVQKFLGETHMVFTGYEYDQVAVMYGDYLCQWSPRAWGALVTRWANQENWLGKRDWTYLDFYGGLNDRAVKDYLAWSEAVMQVVHAKCLLSQQAGQIQPLYKTAP
ncbi:MAG TPA: hypothetical protein VN256_03855 [Pyrinomonadaceae bacterium]|nr:hypothetical protein [Pyrinomonadaceae bacterium]